MKLKPVHVVPFRLNNIGDFLNREHPVLFPESPKYEEYWTEQARRCVEGMWGYDFADGKGGWRFMPGNLYFYINFFPILHEGDQGTEFSGFPLLRDIDWLQFYAYLECDGFAGFSGDDKYTCFRPIGKLERNEPISNKDKKLIKKYEDYLYDKNGKLKKYKEAKEYLYQTFDEPMGLPLVLNEASNVIFLSSRAVGKDLWEESTIFTEYGPKQIKEAKVGDRIYGADGKLTTIVDVAKYNNQIQYEVELDDGRVVTCGDGHLWEVTLPGGNGPIVLPLKEIRKRYKGYYRASNGTTDKNIFIKIGEAVKFPHRKLPIDPYFLGLWLGDGTSSRVEITTMDDEIGEYVAVVANSFGCDVSIFNTPDNGKAKTHKIVRTSQDRHPINTIFSELNLFNNKHIPDIYQYASEEQRLALLQGLLDTDGSIGANGHIEFVTKYEHLAKQVMLLTRSLGIKTKQSIRTISFMKDPNTGKIIKFDTPRNYYRIRLQTGLPVFRLSRKLSRVIPNPKAEITISNRKRNAIVDVRPVGVKPSVCIGVDNSDNLFLTDNYVVTHNSYGVAGGVVTYDFTFNGARNIYDFVDEKTSTTVVVGAGVSSKSQEFLDKVASGYDFLRTHVGAFIDGDYVAPGAFWRPYEGSLALNKAITNRVRIKGGRGFDGPGSKIVHVSYQQSASAGVGYRARRMVVEEAGLLDKFTQVHAENSATQRRETKMGYTIYLGTGGDIEKIRQIRDAFYNPESYDCVSFPDVFNGTGKGIGMFIPAYYRSALFKDENGNTDVQAAFDDEMLERDKKRKEGSKAYEGHIISYPILPQEMFMQSGGNAFPTDLIEERINELEVSGEYKKYSVGQLHYMSMKNDICEWKEDTKKELKPILRYGDEDNMRDKRGAIVIYEHPMDQKPQPTYNNPLYLVVYDPVSKDGTGSSLCSVLVFKTWYLDDLTTMQYNVVAEWIGRHERQADNHEVAFKLAAYYGAKILPEINNTDILTYGRMTNRYHWLQPRPGLALSGMINQKSNYDVGVRISPTMIPHLEASAAELLITPIDKSVFIDGADELVVETKMVSKMRSMRLLEELLYYNRDDNFDHVSALFLVSVWVRQQKLQPIQYAAVQNADAESLKLKSMFNTRPSLKGHPAFDY